MDKEKCIKYIGQCMKNINEIDESDVKVLKKLYKYIKFMVEPENVNELIKLIKKYGYKKCTILRNWLYKYNYYKYGLPMKSIKEMTKTEIKKLYEHGKIYEISCEETGKKYVGSTVANIKIRFFGHIVFSVKYKRKKIKMYKYLSEIGWEKAVIFLVEKYPCKKKRKLEKREAIYYDKIKENKRLNSVRPRKKKQKKKTIEKIDWKKSRFKTIKKYLIEQNLNVEEIEYLIEQLDEQTTKLLDKMEPDEKSDSEDGKMIIIYKNPKKNKPKKDNNFVKYACRYKKYSKIMSFLKKIRKELENEN